MSSNQHSILLRFDKVSFAYHDGKHPILEDASFTIRQHTKITIMGQNGAGKSTIFKMIMGELHPQEGNIHLDHESTVAIARQLIPRDQMNKTVREFFETAFDEKDYALDKKIAKVLKEVNFTAPIDQQLHQFSGGQQARLLLAYALIQDPDILLLDEPTNNLDKNGINDLIAFLFAYEKTVVVISHDADFLNLFTDGVLYLNKDRKQVEQYRGDYYTVVEQIAAQIEKEKMQNARAVKKIADAKEKISQFAQKGGKMRKLAKKMRGEVEEAEDDIVEVRKDDKTIPHFQIPFENFVGSMITINQIGLMNAQYEVETHNVDITIKKSEKYLLHGPNGIGKSTLLKNILDPKNNQTTIGEGINIGYYSQDFDVLDMEMVVRDALKNVGDNLDQDVYRIAARFLLTGSLLKNPIGLLSEGQKGLLCYAMFVLQSPHVLILDEPTNHINFRHLPIIAQAINDYKGGVLMVCHDQGFVDQLQGFEEVDLGRLLR